MILVSKDYYNGTRTPEYLSFCVPGLDSHVATWFVGDGQWAVTTMATMGRTRLGMPAPSFIHYIVTLYALDIGRLPVSGRLSGQNVFQAMDERIQDTGEKLANYSLNPAMT